ARLTGRNGPGRKIASGRGIEDDDVARIAVELASVAAPAPSEVGIAGQAPVRPGQGLPIVIFIGDQGVPAAPAAAEGLAELIFSARPVAGVSDPDAAFGALVVVSQDDVDDAAHGVGAIE